MKMLLSFFVRFAAAAVLAVSSVAVADEGDEIAETVFINTKGEHHER